MNGSCSMEPTLRTSAILTHKDSTGVSVESTVSVRDRSLLEELLSEKQNGKQCALFPVSLYPENCNYRWCLLVFHETTLGD